MRARAPPALPSARAGGALPAILGDLDHAGAQAGQDLPDRGARQLDPRDAQVHKCPQLAPPPPPPEGWLLVARRQHEDGPRTAQRRVDPRAPRAQSQRTRWAQRILHRPRDPGGARPRCAKVYAKSAFTVKSSCCGGTVDLQPSRDRSGRTGCINGRCLRGPVERGALWGRLDKGVHGPVAKNPADSAGPTKPLRLPQSKPREVNDLSKCAFCQNATAFGSRSQ